jgi:hypothetical protein
VNKKFQKKFQKFSFQIFVGRLFEFEITIVTATPDGAPLRRFNYLQSTQQNLNQARPDEAPHQLPAEQ